MQFIQHDVPQILKHPRPLRVVRQDSRVQHVRIRHDHMPALANGLARVARRVAIVRKDAKAIVQSGSQIVQLGQLILRQRLGGEKIQRARVWIFQHRV